MDDWQTHMAVIHHGAHAISGAGPSGETCVLVLQQEVHFGPRGDGWTEWQDVPVVAK